MDSQSAARNYNPFEEPQRSNPYPFFADLRREVPVFYAPQIDHWVVSRYEDVKRIFMDPKSFSALNALTPIHELSPAAKKVLEDGGFCMTRAFGNNDRPEHTRFRKRVQRAFTPKYLKGHEPRLRQLIEAFVDRLEPLGEADLMDGNLPDISATLILDMLGVPDDEIALLIRGSKERALYIWGKPEPDHQRELAAELGRLFSYCRRLVDSRIENPRDDLASEIVRVEPGEDSFTGDELASIIFAFFTAGHDTTSSLMGNTVYQLLHHQDAWLEICRNPALIPGAIDEVLRFSSAVIGWRRITACEVEIAGTSIPKGEQILMLLGSANRDAAVFGDPDRFDISRENANRHFSFGKGIHTCIGNVLSKLDVQILLECMVRRMPGLRLTDEGVAIGIPAFIFNSVTRLPVRWR